MSQMGELQQGKRALERRSRLKVLRGIRRAIGVKMKASRSFSPPKSNASLRPELRVTWLEFAYAPIRVVMACIGEGRLRYLLLWNGPRPGNLYNAFSVKGMLLVRCPKSPNDVTEVTTAGRACTVHFGLSRQALAQSRFEKEIDVSRYMQPMHSYSEV